MPGYERDEPTHILYRGGVFLTITVETMPSQSWQPGLQRLQEIA